MCIIYIHIYIEREREVCFLSKELSLVLGFLCLLLKGRERGRRAGVGRRRPLRRLHNLRTYNSDCLLEEGAILAQIFTHATYYCKAYVVYK